MPSMAFAPLMIATFLLVALPVATSGQTPEPGDSQFVAGIVFIFDLDGDGAISERELKRARHTLTVFDDDGDGQVTRVELTANLEDDDSRQAFRMAARLLNSDRDDDGKLSKAETPERMRANITHLDADKDGLLSGTELKARFRHLIDSGVNVEVRAEPQ